MDEVLEKLGTTVINSESKDDNKSSFEGLYKNWGKLSNQEERRKETLELQKSNRNCKLDKFRGILELVNAIEEKEIFKSKQKTYYRPSIYVAGFHRASPTYNNVLMMSEWMIEKPEDFDENWYITPCPKGLRMLVVANQGKTKFFTKYGKFKFECRTALPGGNPSEPRHKNRCCVLDCFYNEKINTLYVLDLLAWNNQPMTDGETEFRYYWLKSQFEEYPELLSINKNNKVIFSLLPKESCTLDSLNKFVKTYPYFKDNYPAMDGFLFYHKRAHYVSGETPLVGWLYPYMMPEVLGSDITVNEGYLLEKPIDYVNQAEFIKNFESKLAKKTRDRSRRTSTNSAMDTAEVNKNENQTKEESQTKNVEDTKEMESEETEVQNNENMDSENTKSLKEIPEDKAMS